MKERFAFFAGYLSVFCAFYGVATELFALAYPHLGQAQWIFLGWKLMETCGLDPVALTWAAMPVAGLVSAAYGWKAYQQTLG